MFKRLREKIENVEASSPTKYNNSDGVSPLVNRRINVTGKNPLENELIRSDSLSSLTGSETEMPTESSSREDLLKLLRNKSSQVKRLEVKLAACGQSLKERNRECEKLTSTLEKQQDMSLRKLNKLNEAFQEDKLKFEATSQKFEAQDKENQRLCDLITEWEKQKEDFENAKTEFFEKRDNNAELQDLQLQELAKLKHMVMNGEKVSKNLQIELDHTMAEKLQIQDKNIEMESQVNKNLDIIESLQKEISKEMEEKTSLLDLNGKSKSLLEKLTNENSEFEKKISDLNLQLQKKSSSLTELEFVNGNLHDKYETMKHNNLTIINKTSNDLTEKGDMIKHLEEKIQTLEQRSTTEKLPQDEQVKALLDERQALEEKLEEIRQQLNNVKVTWAEKINQLETQVSHLNVKIAEDSSEINEKNTTLKNLNEKLSLLQEELKVLTENNKELTLNNKTYLQQITELDSTLIEQKSSHENEILNLKEQHTKEHESKLLKLKLMESQSKEDIQILHKNEIEKLNNKNKLLTQEKENLFLTSTQKLEKIKTELKTTQEDIQTKEKENIKLVSKLEKLTQENDEKNKNEENLNLKQNELSSEVLELQTQLTKLTQEHEKLLTEHQESSEKFQIIETEFKTKELELNETINKMDEKQLENHSAEVNKIQASLEMRTNEVMECKKEIAQIKNTQVADEESISELEQEKTKLENQLLDKERSYKLLLLKYNDLKKSLQKEMKKAQPVNEENGKKDQQPSSSVNENSTIDPIFSLLSGNMSLDDPTLSNEQREVVLKYLKHVVLRFLSSSHTEAQPLIKAISAILQFTPDEENLVKDIMNYKTSWFSSKPSMKQLNKASVKNKSNSYSKK